jgi:mRNA-decapping enzyme subunit 2
MVAPFIAPLKGWIKQQNKLDKHRMMSTDYTMPVTAGATDTEEVEVDLDDTTADEALVPETEVNDGSFANLVAQLKRGHRPSDALPEVSAEQQDDPAEALKNLLGVRDASEAEAAARLHNPPVNPLLAMFQQGNSSFPRTPLHQFMSPQVQPHSPHGQHHPRPPQFDPRPPPPLFPFSPHHLPFHGFQQPHIAPQHINVMPVHVPQQHFMSPPPHQPTPVFPNHASNPQHAFSQQLPQSYQHAGHAPLSQPQFSGVHGPAVPPPTRSQPELTAHRLGLLNAFKAHEQPTPSQLQSQSQPVEAAQSAPRMQGLPTQNRGFESLVSPAGLVDTTPTVPSPPPFQSRPPSTSFQPAQPKPQSAQQAALLNIFRTTPVPAITPPLPKELEPAELSALPMTPGDLNVKPSPQQTSSPKPNPELLALFGQQSTKPELTSATVLGPVNVPDFHTVKKNVHMDANGYSRGTSPAPRKITEQRMSIPQQTLGQESTMKPSPINLPHGSRTGSPRTIPNGPAPPATFKPQILKRPQQKPSPVPALGNAPNPLLALLGSQSSPVQAPISPMRSPVVPAAQPSFDRRESAATDQKAKLLSMFQQPSRLIESPVQPSTSFVPPSGQAQPSPSFSTLRAKSPLPGSPVVLARSPQPPTPRPIFSGIVSPVSPLLAQASQQNSPADLASRSRISSIGEVMPPHIVIPELSSVPAAPLTAIQTRNGYVNGGAEVGPSASKLTGMNDSLGSLVQGREKASSDEKSPTAEKDKSFLLSYLNNYAKGTR